MNFYQVLFLFSSSLWAAQSQEIYEITPIETTQTTVSLEQIEAGRVYSHFSQVLKKRVFSIATKTSDFIYEIDVSTELLKAIYGPEVDTKERGETANSDNTVKIQWWPLGHHTVLSGDFFGLDQDRKFRLISTGKDSPTWEELPSEDKLLASPENPIILRAFDTLGNGLFAWRFTPFCLQDRGGEEGLSVEKDPCWVPLTSYYNLKKGHWVISEKGIRTEVLFVSSDRKAVRMLMEGYIWNLAQGDVVPSKFIDPNSKENKRYRYVIDSRTKWAFFVPTEDEVWARFYDEQDHEQYLVLNGKGTNRDDYQIGVFPWAEEAMLGKKNIEFKPSLDGFYETNLSPRERRTAPERENMPDPVLSIERKKTITPADPNILRRALELRTLGGLD